MRKSSEAPDDIGVQLRPSRKIGIAKLADERDSTLLVGQAFGMLEREIKEHTLGPGDLLIEAARHCALGHRTRKRVGRARVGSAAEHVARTLSEHNDERER